MLVAVSADFDVQELACGLTLHESAIFCRIQPGELRNMAWQAEDKATTAPNVTALSDHFNRVGIALTCVHVQDMDTRCDLPKASEICIDCSANIGGRQKDFDVEWQCFMLK